MYIYILPLPISSSLPFLSPLRLHFSQNGSHPHFATPPCPQFPNPAASSSSSRTQALGIPNPTDEAIGIDEHTELRLALEAANETRSIPDSVRSNRELHKYAKAMIGDMVVPEEVRVCFLVFFAPFFCARGGFFQDLLGEP